MISLKVDHLHRSHLPCHPTRAYQERQQSIRETQRQQISDNDQIMSKQQQTKIINEIKNQFKTIQSRDVPTIDIIQLTPRKRKKKPITKLTPDQIYHTNVIEEAFQGSIKILPLKIRQLIMQKQKLVQDKVYLGVSQKGSNLLQRMYEQMDIKTHLKDQIQQNLNDMMSQIQYRLQQDILNGHKYIIHKIVRSKKEDIIKNKKRVDPNQLTFNSMQTLQTGKNQTSKDDSQSFVSSQPSHQDFSLKSEKTRKAQQFIKKIQQQQQKHRKKIKQQQQLKKSFEVRSLEQKRQFQQQIKSERRNYLKRRIEAKKDIKDKEIQIRQKMNKQYKQFLKKYKSKTPLFKKKQEQYSKLQQQQRKRQQMTLQKRRLEKNTINIEQLKQHQKKYKQLKQQKKNQKINEKKLIQDNESEQVQKYFRGKFHSILAQEQQMEKQRERLEREDPKYNRYQLKKKRDIYARFVRDNHFPKSDQAKQKQLKQLIQKLQWTQKLKSGRLDIKQRNQTGNQYLKRLHELIGQLRAKDKLPLISKSIDFDHLENSTRPHYKNYLQQIKSTSKRRYSIDFEKIAEVDAQDAHFRARKLEQNAKRREVYVMGGNFSIDRTLQQRKKIDDQYLQSVKAKMALLNKFD